MLFVVLLRFSVGVEFSVLGHDSVSLAMGVNDAKNSRPPGKGIPSTILMTPLEHPGPDLGSRSCNLWLLYKDLLLDAE